MASGLTHFETSASGMALRLAGVSITLGSTTLAVMSLSCTSLAMV